MPFTTRAHTRPSVRKEKKKREEKVNRLERERQGRAIDSNKYQGERNRETPLTQDSRTDEEQRKKEEREETVMDEAGPSRIILTIRKGKA